MLKHSLAIPIWIAIGTLIFTSIAPLSIGTEVTPTRANPDNISTITTEPAFMLNFHSQTLSAHDNPSEADRIRPGPVAFQTILQSEFGHAPAGLTVVNDPETWSKFWQQNCSPCEINSTSNTPIIPSLPQVDFTTHSLIIASPGLEGNPGVTFKIDNVIDHAHHIIIEATLTTPGPYCLWIQEIVYPEQIILIPRTSLSSTLDMRTIQGPACPI